MTDASMGAKPDHNSLGKAAFIVGLIALILSFIPIIGFASWLLAPLAIIFGLIALRKAPRALAMAGLVTGGLGLWVCIGWIGAMKSVGESFSKDTFNTTGETVDLSAAPILDAKVQQIWADMEANKVAAGQKYGGQRLRFTDEAIRDFGGDAANPSISFVGKKDDYLIHFVSASFSADDGQKIAGLKKGEKVSFVCTKVRENLGDGYSLSDCKLS